LPWALTKCIKMMSLLIMISILINHLINVFYGFLIQFPSDTASVVRHPSPISDTLSCTTSYTLWITRAVTLCWITWINMRMPKVNSLKYCYDALFQTVNMSNRGGFRRWSWGAKSMSRGRKSPSGVQGWTPGRGLRSWSILKYTTWNLRPCENERHNLMPLMAFFIAMHPAGRGYFRYVLTVVC